MKIVDLIGQSFGRLQIISKAEVSKNKRLWLCQCICGKTLKVRTACLKNGNTKSCGCLNNDMISKMSKGQTWSRKEKGAGGFNRLFRCYKKSALDRELSFLLTEEEFKIITKLNCHYCNTPPKNIKTTNVKEATIEGIKHSEYIYNGIDRLDNEKGYIKDNCLPCCTTCNYMKGKLSYNEFLIQIKNIHENMKRSLTCLQK